MPLSDAKLKDLAEEREELKLKISKLKSKLDKKDQAIINEMSRRGTTAVENGGLRISLVQSERVSYNEDRLKEALEPRLWKRATRQVLDVAALSQLIQSGKVDPNVVAAASEVKLSAPYIRVSTEEE